MPISPVGRTSSRGITLLELVIVMAIIGLIAGVSFPSMTAGLDSIRMSSASDEVASFLNGAVNRAERRQEPVLLTIFPRTNKLQICTNEPGFTRDLLLPDGVIIDAVLPRLEDVPEKEPRRLVLMPGGTAPAIGVQLINRRGTRRLIRLDPMTGSPHIESVVKE